VCEPAVVVRELPGAADQPSVRPPCSGDEGVAVEAERQRETVGVIGVVADQVDPPGCGPDPLGLAAELAVECRREVVDG
jgi:hypothetical protein